MYKQYFLLILLSGSVVTIAAQETELKKFQALYAADKHTEIIALAKNEKPDWQAKTLYYIGMAYYKKGDDTKALQYLDKAIEKGPADQDMYYYKGRTLFYLRRNPEAMKWMDKALSLLPEEPDYLAGKADVFFAVGAPDSAVALYERAIAQPSCRGSIYLSLADAYLGIPDEKNALRVYKEGIKKISAGTEEHQTCMYNLGLLHYLAGQFQESKEAYESLLAAYPDDYRAISKLIQVYYALGEPVKVKPLRKNLYDAYAQKKLPEEMSKMFCMDQFEWNGKKIMVFENFNNDETETLLVKHQFFILTDSSTIDFQVRSESSFAVRMAGKDSKYVLCLVRNGSYSTFWNFVFNDETPYADIKKAVLDILDKKVKPTAGTYVNPKKE